MQIEFSPQRSDVHVNYEFADEIVTVLLNDVQEVYDFTDMPDGEIQEINMGVLPTSVVLAARRVNGELTVALVLTHDHADYAPVETRFPNNPYTVAEAEALLIARNNATPDLTVKPFQLPLQLLARDSMEEEPGA